MAQNLLGSRIVGGNTAYKRNERDFYPTPTDVTVALIKACLDLQDPTLSIWECACGDGHISKVFEQQGHHVVSTDISSACYGQGQTDFLMCGKRKADFIVTNPPFSLSEQFIEHAQKLGGNCAFLLKSQYWHAKRRLKLFRNFAPAYVFPLTWRPDFTFGQRGGGSPLMDVMWCVWGYSDSKNTIYRPIEKPLL